jgi:hypothetical protein
MLFSCLAFANAESPLKSLFPENSASKCSPEIIVEQKADDSGKKNILAFINCHKNGKQDHKVRLATYEESPAKLISKGLVEAEKNKELSLQTIFLTTQDSKISSTDPVFQMRIQYKSVKDGSLTEELIVLREHNKEISTVLKGPLGSYPGKGRAFLIITKNKTNGFADIAIKSEFKIEAFRWRGSAYTPFTREEIEHLKK